MIHLRQFLFSSLLLFLLRRTDCQDYGDFNGEKFCPPFHCSKGYEAVPKSRMKLTSSGCNSLGGMMVMKTSSTSDDDPVQPCCDQLNACYQICGSNHAVCKDTAVKCMEKACDGLTPDRKSECESSISVTKLMIQFSGCNKFDEGQRANCDCVEKSKAPNRRKKAITQFYEKHNKSGLDKVNGLVEKANTTHKLANLFTKLVAKYPKSITRVKDPGSSWMDDLMNEKKVNKDDNLEQEEEYMEEENIEL